MKNEDLKTLLGNQCPLPFLADIKKVVALREDELLMRYIDLFSYGYIQGKRAERARRKKGGNHE